MGNVFEKVSQIVKIFDVAPFQVGDGEAYRFRLEVSLSESEQTYIGKVYRLETYRLQPTFPQNHGILPNWKNDALIFVDDVMFDSKLHGATVEEVLIKFKSALEKNFGEAMSRNANL